MIETSSLFLDLLTVFGTVLAVRDVWFKGTIIASWKAAAETLEGKLGKLLNCKLCLTYHLPYLILIVYYSLSLILPDWYKWLFYSLALTGFANRFDVWSFDQTNSVTSPEVKLYVRPHKKTSFRTNNY